MRVEDIDFDLLRHLARRASAESPLRISGQLPKLHIDEGGPLTMRFEIPETEGVEFSHWRMLNELGLIRVSHDGRPGFGKVDNQVEGITAKGIEFVALSSNDEEWRNAVEVCTRARALIFPNIVSELRTQSRDRIRAAKRKPNGDENTKTRQSA